MRELHPEKLHVTYQEGTLAKELSLPRRYTLTHSDFSGDLFLTIGSEYDRRQISGLYTRLMRDEVLAELRREGSETILHVYCHVSGGIVLGSAAGRNEILHYHMRLVLEALRYGERELVSSNPDLNRSAVKVHFASNLKKYDCVEEWGCLQDFE